MRSFVMTFMIFLTVPFQSTLASGFSEKGLALEKSLTNKVPCPVITTQSRFFQEGQMLDTDSGVTVSLNDVLYKVAPNHDKAPFPTAKDPNYIVSNFTVGACRYSYRVTKKALTTLHAKGLLDAMHDKKQASKDAFGISGKSAKDTDKEVWTDTFVLEPVTSTQPQH
ncbi:MAG: hypothetical protein LCH26_04430 [Proteobacteria bacterium]|nr:hypothetical protein [Pseudomonadota bacterium]